MLTRQPTVALALALALASAVLALSAASGPLFLASAGSASMHAQAAQSCPEQAMPSVSLTAAEQTKPYTATENHRLTEEFTAAYAGRALPAADNVLLARSTLAATSVPPSSPLYVHTFYRKGALDHIRKLAAVSGTGVWLTDVVAGQLGLAPGSDVFIAGNAVRVVGLYRQLDDALDPTRRLDRYWCSWHEQITPSVLANSSPVFAIANDPSIPLADPASVRSSWYSPVDAGRISLGQAAEASTAAQAGEREVVDQAGLSAAVSDSLAEVASRASDVRDGVRGAVVPVAIGGLLVALSLVGGAALFWSHRRQRETRLLISRGVSPAQLGVKASLETAPWVVIGTAAGACVALVGVKTLGPSAAVEAGAARRALLACVAAAVAGLVLVGGFGAASTRSRSHTDRRRWLVTLPYEIGLIGAAVLAYRSVHGVGVTVDDAAIVRLRPAVVAFALLGMAGAVLLATRLARLSLPVLRRIGRRSTLAVFLAFSRMATGPAVALGLLAGVAMPSAMLIYAAGVEQSLQESIMSKYHTNIGAPHVFSTVARGGATFDAHGAGTQVSVVQQQPQAAGQQLQLLGVDADTFARYAFLNENQRRDVTRLSRPQPDGRVNAIVVNNTGGPEISAVTVLNQKLELQVIANTNVFPGLRNANQPMVVLNRAAIADLPDGIDRTEQLWTDDQHARMALLALSRQNVSVLYELTPQVLIDDTGLLPVTWTLDYLNSIAITTGLVAIAAVVFALGARANRRAVAYVMSTRMGIGRGVQLSSLLIEVGLVVGMGWALGTALAECAVVSVYGLLDPLPTDPPTPTFSFDGATVSWLGLSAAVVSIAAAAFAHIAANRTPPARTMRAP